jgi:hypothetical protein
MLAHGRYSYGWVMTRTVQKELWKKYKQTSYLGWLTTNTLRAVQEVLENDYWMRLWIIQEFVLARTILIRSGTLQACGDTVRHLTRMLVDDHYCSEIAQIWEMMELRSKSIISGYDRDWPCDSNDVPTYGAVGRFSWQEVIRLVRSAKCADVRDRVYGMLSLVGGGIDVNVFYGMVDVDYNAFPRR